MRLAVERRLLALVEPLHTAYGVVRERELALVAVTGDDGVSGHGEAAPLPAYDGVGIEEVLRVLHAYEPVLARAEADGLTGAQVVDACRALADVPIALAAIEVALWDIAGRRAGRPIASLLTDRPAASVPVNATIAAEDRAGVAAAAAAAQDAGYSCIKVKVGLGDDAGRVAAARAAAGPEMALRLDANGAWDIEQAVAAIETLAPAGLELVEEPVHGLREVRAVRERVAVRVAIDETAGEPGALASGAADAVCLKLARCGGISGLLAAAALVRAAGAEPYIASTLDGPLGIAAAVHAAAALASRGPLPHCGLGTLALFGEVEAALAVRNGAIRVPVGGGLGVAPL